MRSKIKQLLKKEGGFTLVELLAVLAILALIVGIAIPMVGNVINTSKVKADNAQIELVVDAARLYQIEKEVADEGTIAISDLTPEFLDEDIVGKTVGGVKIAATTTVSELKEAIAE